MQRETHNPDRPYDQTALFRPSLAYPTHPYDELLTQTAQRFPEQTALIFRDISITYRELEALVNALANGLRDMGVHKGDCVCLLMTNRAEFLLSWFAITRIGAVVSTLNPSYREREVAYQMSNCDAVAIIVQHELVPIVEKIRGDISTLQIVIAVGHDEHPSTGNTVSFDSLLRTHSPMPPKREAWSWDDLLALPYSSGTTGMPKGVMLSQKNLLYNACQSLATARITSQDRMLVFLPLYHIYGIMLLGTSMMSGARLVLMERFDAAIALRLIQEQSITLLYAVPQILSLLSNWPQLKNYDLSSIRYVQCGAAPVPPPLARQFEERTHVPVMTSYGLTEASPGTHSNPVYEPRRIKLETIGLPIHDTRQKIVDIETGTREVAVGEEGELIVQGPQVMLGYWKSPEATAEVLRDGWLYTGDIGRLDAEGYVTVTDRKKELIKVKGFSVAPAQIEALLLEHPAVADVAVIAKQNEEAGEVPKAFVVRREGYDQLTALELLTWANGKLAAYKNVREVEFIEAIPRNPSGKILRRVLKDQERSRMGFA